jgi:cytochrome c oxidase cbb3-type subunit 3
MGMRMFATECAQCHGSDARGSFGFPNLTDDNWLYGGTPEDIKTTLLLGRKAAMPAWGDILGEEGIDNVAAYLLSLNGRVPDKGDESAGAEAYQTYCIACHGTDAAGNTALGAPNLKNGIWLYGGSPEQVRHSLRAGRNGVMPAFGNTLSEDKIHILTAYVYGLNQ